ncbi:AraC family transcriptional regulator [Reyranella sp.]|jgi:AraC-like DNA-binding protein|uniref:AraC family transcriptional regulator n=1 Tax=Reyranella sp. TaxID=1929291 RepID=UPI0025DAE869|nr:AraC family transcriptional regulator [Reyranella sp.]
MDPLSEVIGLLRPHAALSKPITGRGRWGVRYAAYGQPGFALVLEGRCWLAVEDAEPALVDRGDFVLLPATPAFSLMSEPGADCLPVEPTNVAVRHGDATGEPDFRMFGGAFQVEPAHAGMLLALLPRVIHVRAADRGTERLARLVDLIAEECAGVAPGRDMILERLLEVMMMECLRGNGPAGNGIGERGLSADLLAGLRDGALARALEALHADVRAKWTVAGLAKLAGMSRSAFAARFAEVLGCSPIEYLLRWRMTLACDALRRGGVPLDRVALAIGYDSASAFSTAFRKRFGCSPGAYGRAQQTGRTAALQ